MKRALLLVIVVVFLIGCQSALEDLSEETTALEEKIKQTIEESEVTLPQGKCTPQWKCISSKFKSYQDADCELTKKTECPAGCENNTCIIKEIKVCTAGWKCVNNFTRGFLLESCKFIDKKDCDFRCDNNKCIPKPANYTEPVVETPKPTIPIYSAKTLKFGEEVEENGHLIKIKLVEADRVKISIDGSGSNWLSEGQKYSKNGITIEIKGIFFQAYAGGKQEIDYSVS